MAPARFRVGCQCVCSLPGTLDFWARHSRARSLVLRLRSRAFISLFSRFAARRTSFSASRRAASASCAAYRFDTISRSAASAV